MPGAGAIHLICFPPHRSLVLSDDDRRLELHDGAEGLRAALGSILERAQLLMARERSSRFRVTARDNNGDIFAFESPDRDRTKRKLEQFQSRKELHDLHMETSRMVGDRSKRYRITGTDINGDIHAFETGNIDRAKGMVAEFRTRFQDVEQESQRWI